MLTRYETLALATDLTIARSDLDAALKRHTQANGDALTQQLITNALHNIKLSLIPLDRCRAEAHAHLVPIDD